MSSIEYSLFRVKFVRPSQASFLDKGLTPSEIFIGAVDERPSAELRKGYRWHVGNVHYFSDRTGYFAIGRTTNSTVEKFDESSGNFLEEELEKSPYTHCVFNATIGFIGIAKKASLSPSSKGIAARIEELFAKTQSVLNCGVKVEVQPIPDPDGFIKSIAEAYRVFSFTATFRGPNPFDADEHFQRPLAVYLASAQGEKGKAQIQGEDLNRQVLQSVTRSTAATGNEASARIIRARAQKPITINLRGDPIKRKYDEATHSPVIVLEDLNSIYEKVRHDK